MVLLLPIGMPLQKLGSLLADDLKLGAASGKFPLSRAIVVATAEGAWWHCRR